MCLSTLLINLARYVSRKEKEMRDLYKARMFILLLQISTYAFY